MSVARSCRSGISALRSLSGVKRTRYAQVEFFSFWTQRTLSARVLTWIKAKVWELFILVAAVPLGRRLLSL
jgi:hypothetical protein